MKNDIRTPKGFRNFIKNELCSVKRDIKKIKSELKGGSDNDIDKVKDDVLRFKEVRMKHIIAGKKALATDFVITSGLDRSQSFFDESVLISGTYDNIHTGELMLLPDKKEFQPVTWDYFIKHTKPIPVDDSFKYVIFNMSVYFDFIYTLNGKDYYFRNNYYEIPHKELFFSINDLKNANYYTKDDDHKYYRINDWMVVSVDNNMSMYTQLYIKKNDTGKIRIQNLKMRISDTYNPALLVTEYHDSAGMLLLPLDNNDDIILPHLETEITITQLP